MSKTIPAPDSNEPAALPSDYDIDWSMVDWDALAKDGWHLMSQEAGDAMMDTAAQELLDAARK